jgi:hypothetical protein
MATPKAPPRDEIDDLLDEALGTKPQPTPPASQPLQPGTTAHNSAARPPTQLPPGMPPELAAIVEKKGLPYNWQNPGLDEDDLFAGQLYNYVWEDNSYVQVRKDPDSGQMAVVNQKLTQPEQGGAKPVRIEDKETGDIYLYDYATKTKVRIHQGSKTQKPTTVPNKSWVVDPQTGELTQVGATNTPVSAPSNQPNIASRDAKGNLVWDKNLNFDQAAAARQARIEEITLAHKNREMSLQEAKFEIDKANNQFDQWYKKQTLETTRRGQDMNYAGEMGRAALQGMQGALPYLVPKGWGGEFAGALNAINAGKPAPSFSPMTAEFPYNPMDVATRVAEQVLGRVPSLGGMSKGAARVEAGPTGADAAASSPAVTGDPMSGGGYTYTAPTAAALEGDRFVRTRSGLGVRRGQGYMAMEPGGGGLSPEEERLILTRSGLGVRRGGGYIPV